MFEADVSGSLFSRANLYEIKGEGLKALKTDFYGARLGSARLINGDFTEANFDGAMLENADFKGAALKNAVWGTAFKRNTGF